MAQLLKEAKVEVKDGELIISINLDLNINLNTNTVSLTQPKEKLEEKIESKWEIPDFKKTSKLNFGKIE